MLWIAIAVSGPVSFHSMRGPDGPQDQARIPKYNALGIRRSLLAWGAGPALHRFAGPRPMLRGPVPGCAAAAEVRTL